ncbi:MAG: DUF1016 domain-containing protein [Bacteroidetes bacterium]|nr:DUF1016 domain-containing protein [Bacteroidota bacterium]
MLTDKPYFEILNNLKEKIRQARIKAIYTANTQLLVMYWEIGNAILQQQQAYGWGAKIVDRFSVDLKTEFPDFKGLSVRNLKYMRSFAEAYPDFYTIVQPHAAQLQSTNNQSNEFKQEIIAQTKSIHNIAFVQQLAAQLPWGHHQLLLDKVKNYQQRLFYMQNCVENSWSRNILASQIENELIKRQGKAISNFKDILPALDSDLVRETFKNPYVFDFLMLGEEAKEREVERALMQHLKKFMLELGKGFAYVGNQFNIEVKNDEYFLDLLFYNYHLHRFVVFELKVGNFKPEYAGKLNFYINTVDGQIKNIKDDGTIGILLCKTPNELVIRYSLQGIKTPICVSEYYLKKGLPKVLKTELPSIEELEAEINNEYKGLKSSAKKKLGSIKRKITSNKKRK